MPLPSEPAAIRLSVLPHEPKTVHVEPPTHNAYSSFTHSCQPSVATKTPSAIPPGKHPGQRAAIRGHQEVSSHKATASLWRWHRSMILSVGWLEKGRGYRQWKGWKPAGGEQCGVKRWSPDLLMPKHSTWTPAEYASEPWSSPVGRTQWVLREA